MSRLKISLTPLIASLMFSPLGQAEDLVQIYQAALDSDPVISAQKYAFEAISHSSRQIDALYYPAISFDANHSQFNSDASAPASSVARTGNLDYTTTSYSLSLRQSLYRWDHVSQIRQGNANQRKAEAELNQAYQTLILRVSQRYFDTLAAQDNLGFSQAEKNAIARQLEQAKQRFEVGLIAITGVHEAQAAYDLSVAGEIVAQNQLAIARQSLRELTGQLPQEIATLGNMMQLTPPDPASLDEWVSTALNNNQNIAAARSALDAAMQGREQQRANRHPKLDLVASFGNDEFSGDTIEQEKETLMISLQLNIPLYQGGGISAGIRSANASLNQAREGLEQQRRATQRETSDAYLSVLAGISQVKALQQAVISSNSALSATEAGYEVGTRTTVDVLNSQRELFRTQRDAARARYDYILASLRLQQAAGMLDADDVQQINAWLN